jgi:hypothetical protein
MIYKARRSQAEHIREISRLLIKLGELFLEEADRLAEDFDKE